MSENEPKSPSPFSWHAAKVVHRDNLPHVRQDNVIYFVTFRLGDSLPEEKVLELREKRDAWLKINPQPHSPEQERKYKSIWTVKIENLMDAGHGGCELKNPKCRDILRNSLTFNDGKTYELGSYVIMPNHVHLLVRMIGKNELSTAIKGWKSFSAREINRMIQRTDSFWMEEYFDHAVRNIESLDQFKKYINDNPRYLQTGTFTVGHGCLRI